MFLSQGCKGRRAVSNEREAVVRSSKGTKEKNCLIHKSHQMLSLQRVITKEFQPATCRFTKQVSKLMG